MQHRARGSQSKSLRTRVDGASNGSPPSSVIGSWEKEVSLGRNHARYVIKGRRELSLPTLLTSLP